MKDLTDYDAWTVEDCVRYYEYYGLAAIINDGHMVGFYLNDGEGGKN